MFTQVCILPLWTIKNTDFPFTKSTKFSLLFEKFDLNSPFLKIFVEKLHFPYCPFLISTLDNKKSSFPEKEKLSIQRSLLLIDKKTLRDLLAYHLHLFQNRCQSLVSLLHLLSIEDTEITFKFTKLLYIFRYRYRMYQKQEYNVDNQTRQWK